MFIVYYIICIIYCFYQLNRKYSLRGLDYASPEMDAIMVLIMAWVLAPVDVSITWIRMVREAEEAKRRHEAAFISFKDDPKKEKELLRDSIYE